MRKEVQWKLNLLKWGVMKIADYLIIVSTWLLSSYTFSTSDVEFKSLKEENGSYYIQFGVVGHNESSSIEVESILLQLPHHQVTSVTKRNQGYIIKVTTSQEPDFHSFRALFKPYGYEMDNRFFKIYNQELLDEIVSKLKKLRKDQTKLSKQKG